MTDPVDHISDATQRLTSNPTRHALARELLRAGRNNGPALLFDWWCSGKLEG